MRTVSVVSFLSPAENHKGIGVPCDPARARALYDEAQEAGSPAAGYFMGHRFHVGDETLGVEVDGARALQLLRGASEQVCICCSVYRLWHISTADSLSRGPCGLFFSDEQTPLLCEMSFSKGLRPRIVVFSFENLEKKSTTVVYGNAGLHVFSIVKIGLFFARLHFHYCYNFLPYLYPSARVEVLSYPYGDSPCAFVSPSTDTAVSPCRPRGTRRRRFTWHKRIGRAIQRWVSPETFEFLAIWSNKRPPPGVRTPFLLLEALFFTAKTASPAILERRSGASKLMFAHPTHRLERSGSVFIHATLHEVK